MTVWNVLLVSGCVTLDLAILLLLLTACVQIMVTGYFENQYRLIKRIADERLKPPPMNVEQYDRDWQ